jgi:hypothetical protein
MKIIFDINCKYIWKYTNSCPSVTVCINFCLISQYLYIYNEKSEIYMNISIERKSFVQHFDISLTLIIDIPHIIWISSQFNFINDGKTEL